MLPNISLEAVIISLPSNRYLFDGLTWKFEVDILDVDSIVSSEGYMYKILIADDEDEIRNGLRDYFPWKSIGFEVVGTASNSQQAYDIIQSQQVDVLLCDIVMPGMTGLDLAKQLHEESNSVQIVLMSAYSDFHYAKEALEYGVKNYILKSMHFDELIQTLAKLKDALDKSNAPPPDIFISLPYNEKIIFRVKEYVKSNYTNASLEIIALELSLSADYLGKTFKKLEGKAFSDYVMQVRMEKAAALLQDIQYKIYEISDMVGYSNQFNFTRAFKSYFNKTPREYRQDSSEK